MFFKKSLLFCQCLLIATLTSLLSADVSKSSIETQIIDKIAISMFPNQKVTAWGETAYHKNMIQQSTKILPTDSFTNANLLIISKKIPENTSANSIIITTEYSLLAKDPRIVGAFFWQKGRPNLLFLRERMQKSNVTLDREFDKYIEDNL